MKPNLVSIIVRTHNEEKYLRSLLIRIHNQNYKNFEVIIVDSGSTDKTIDIASNFDFVTLYEIDKEDFTFGYSLNYGIEKSKGDIIVTLSGHCWPKNNDWLENLISPYTDEKVGISYGRQIGVEDSKFSEKQILNRWFPSEDNDKQLTTFCNNANCSIRRDIWDKMGGYDERASGLEDVLMATKMLRETDFYISYRSESVVYHIHDESWVQIKDRYYREAITYSSIHLSEKFNLFDFIKLCYINIVHDIVQLVKTNSHIKMIPSIFLFRINQFWGTYKGYKYTKKYNDLRQRFYYPN